MKLKTIAIVAGLLLTGAALTVTVQTVIPTLYTTTGISITAKDKVVRYANLLKLSQRDTVSKMVNEWGMTASSTVFIQKGEYAVVPPRYHCIEDGVVKVSFVNTSPNPMVIHMLDNVTCTDK